ncbi:MAG: sigma-70 family RNA polymerase sigma factor [Acidobacteriota bacterium]
MDKEKAANRDEPAGARNGNERQAAAAALKEQVRQTVAEFQNGVDREKNFRFLFDTFYDSTRYFIGKRVSSPDDCLDLTQETFLRVYRGLEGYRGDAQFGTWVFRIAFNTYLKWLRRAKADEQSTDVPRGTEELESAWDDDEIVAVAADETPLEKVLRTERRRVLRSAIEELPEQMRRCTELRIYHDLSYREIAVVMRRSIETIKVHLFQARKKLKDSFGDVDL